jgi:hypothetical protein
MQLTFSDEGLPNRLAEWRVRVRLAIARACLSSVKLIRNAWAVLGFLAAGGLWVWQGVHSLRLGKFTAMPLEQFIPPPATRWVVLEHIQASLFQQNAGFVLLCVGLGGYAVLQILFDPETRLTRMQIATARYRSQTAGLRDKYVGRGANAPISGGSKR